MESQPSHAENADILQPAGSPMDTSAVEYESDAIVDSSSEFDLRKAMQKPARKRRTGTSNLERKVTSGEKKVRKKHSEAVLDQLVAHYDFNDGKDHSDVYDTAPRAGVFRGSHPLLATHVGGPTPFQRLWIAHVKKIRNEKKALRKVWYFPDDESFALPEQLSPNRCLLRPIVVIDPEGQLPFEWQQDELKGVFKCPHCRGAVASQGWSRDALVAKGLSTHVSILRYVALVCTPPSEC